jgi:hypothetical protein
MSQNKADSVFIKTVKSYGKNELIKYSMYMADKVNINDSIDVESIDAVNVVERVGDFIFLSDCYKISFSKVVVDKTTTERDLYFNFCKYRKFDKIYDSENKENKTVLVEIYPYECKSVIYHMKGNLVIKIDIK